MTTLRDLLVTQAKLTPDAAVLLAPGRAPLRSAELVAQIDRTVSALRAIGIGSADRVAVVLPNGPEMATAFLGVASAATCAPLNPAYREAELEFYLSDLRPKVLLVESAETSIAAPIARRLGARIIELSRPADAPAGGFSLQDENGAIPPGDGPPTFTEAADIALVLHTSGTTSRPKIVPLSQANLCASTENIRRALAITPADRCLNIMPLFHVHGLMAAVVASLTAGAAVICTPGFHAPSFFSWLAELRPTWLTAVPTMLQAALLRAPENAEVIRAAPLRLIRSCSAALPPSVHADLERVFGVPVIEAYGMTEGAHQLASNPLPPGQRKPGSVGLPTGTRIGIEDDAGTVHLGGAEGTPVGEVVVRGPNVLAAYESHPEANLSSFANGWFRTGDKGRLDGDGYLFLTGRSKEIINRAGEKISPREIDEVLLTHPAVAQALAFALPDVRLGEDVGAAVVLREGCTASEPELREHVAKTLSDFKVPRKIVFLPELPKGPTGKPQRIGLAAKLGLDKEEVAIAATAKVAPRTPLESKLVDLWQTILGVANVGVHDDFLHLGGDSLLANQLASRLREITGQAWSAVHLFEAPTVATLAERIEERARAGAARTAPLAAAAPSPGDAASASLVSFAEQRMWFLAQYEEDSSAYVRPSLLHIEGPLDAGALEASLSEIVKRHAVLRSTYQLHDGELVRAVTPPRALSLPIIDLTSVAPAEREEHVRRLEATESARPFDLTRDATLRAILVRCSADEHYLLLLSHHISSDGWSTGVLLREITEIYGAFSAGAASPLPDLPIQYTDYTAWQNTWLASGVLEEQLAYWKTHLLGAPPVLALPTDRPRPARQTFRGGRERLDVSRDLTTALRALGRDERATLFMTLLAAFQTLLSRYTSTEDLVVGIPTANRHSPEVEGLLGLFMNTVPLRTDLSGAPTFRELLGRVRASALGAFANADVPFARLVDALQPPRSTSHSPLYQVLFQVRNFPDREASLAGLQVSHVALERRTADLDLTLEATETRGGLHLVLDFNTDLFDRATARRMLGHYLRLLEEAVKDPDRSIGSLPLLTEAERHQLVVTWNQTEHASPAVCVHELFEAQVERTPEATALIFEEQRLTYRELNERANRLAHHLRGLGVGPEVLVGLCVERSPEMVVGVLGILKAGGAYVPLDPTHPMERLGLMLEDSAVTVLLTLERGTAKLPEHRARALALDTGWASIARESAHNPVKVAAPDNLAYVLYTSGSTGRPKGVMVPHRGLVNYLHWCARAYDTAGGSGSPVHSALGFDLTITGLFSPLLAGRSVLLVPEQGGIQGLVDALRSHDDFSLVKLTPAHLELLARLLPAEEGARRTRALPVAPLDGTATSPNPHPLARALVIGGEALSWEQLSFFRSSFPGTRLFNEYGPTETVVGCSVHEAPADGPTSGPVPIGRPIDNTQLYVLDRSLQPVPIGVPGELYVGGAGVSRGYLNRPELTASSFLQDPFRAEPSARLYRTGDLCRYRPDGDLEYLGRLDHQVKIRGFRVEPGEIESVLAEHPSIREVVVLAREDTPGDRRLVAYLVAGDAPLPGEDELRASLKKRLPDYMVPSAFVALEALPLTPNGKVDRPALPAPDGDRAALQTSFVAPRTPTEEGLSGIWAELLHVDRVGALDSFFDLGGHSLLAAQVIGRVRRLFGVDVPLRALFEAPRLSDLAAVIAGLVDPDSMMEETVL